MKKYISLTVIIIIAFLSSLKAQVYDKKTVHAGQSLSEVSYYLFPSFRDAKVQFKKGGELVSKLNFNLLICQMQFIDPKGDTLNLTRLEDIDEIDFDSTFFFMIKVITRFSQTSMVPSWQFYEKCLTSRSRSGHWACAITAEQAWKKKVHSFTNPVTRNWH